ncbi:AraC family transcriptional regulator [Thalassospira marina]|uniref:AraC family transcriptional regulator n=1 Tax=Thalassospira marina TaxID=2048283 RepID=A0A2N3KZ66_9PROT|nr:AraC family transcriptional regulator [Thalassospira marina]PKR55777.1 AraC family transcriptional regulator [Thalassospira marina]
MSDPLAEIVSLLKPDAPFSKMVSAAGSWRVERYETGKVYYGMMLSGQACLSVENKEPVIIGPGDFVLIPAAYSFSMASVDPPPPPRGVAQLPVKLEDGTFRVGLQDGPPDTQQLIGYCVFDSPDAAVLVPLLPDMIVVRGENRLGVLAKLVADEARANRPAREIILQHLLEALLIETLRSAPEMKASPGLLRGLSDERLGIALRILHEKPGHSWTIAELAKRAGMSRSAFFDRFQKSVGIAPMDYLLNWRMSLAQRMLRQKKCTIAEVAQQVGYGSASAFSVAFSRHVGCPPAQYGRQEIPEPEMQE